MNRFDPDFIAATFLDRLRSGLDKSDAGLAEGKQLNPVDFDMSIADCGVDLRDVVAKLQQLTVDLSIYREIDRLVCVRHADGMVPVSLRTIVGGTSHSKDIKDISTQDLAEACDTLEHVNDADLWTFDQWQWISREFQESLSAFLSARGDQQKQRSRWGLQWRQKRPVSTEYAVTVSCNDHGLRLHSSPSYFIDWTYFGAPSSPVVGQLPAGRYIFSVDGPKLPDVRMDRTVFSVPRDGKPHILVN